MISRNLKGKDYLSEGMQSRVKVFANLKETYNTWLRLAGVQEENVWLKINDFNKVWEPT